MTSRQDLTVIRLVSLCHILEQSSRSLSTNEIRSRLNQDMIWEWSVRTIRADLSRLVALKTVERERKNESTKYRWIGFSRFDPTEL